MVFFFALACLSGITRSQERTIENTLGLRLVLIPAGSFTMGSPFHEKGRQADEFPHEVKLSRPFYIGMTEVTQTQWTEIMGINRSNFKSGDLPVEKISWQDAVLFCKKLSVKEGKTYRLPTEAEWEYACRAGSPDAFGGAGNLADVAWFANNSGDTTHPPGGKLPNAWGIYDMHGNVSEWCADIYDPEYPHESVENPTGPAKGPARVIRGGAWDSFPPGCRAAARSSAPPSYQFTQTGLRVVMEID